jgi:hypothetical protein
MRWEEFFKKMFYPKRSYLQQNETAVTLIKKKSQSDFNEDQYKQEILGLCHLWPYLPERTGILYSEGK